MKSLVLGVDFHPAYRFEIPSGCHVDILTRSCYDATRNQGESQGAPLVTPNPTKRDDLLISEIGGDLILYNTADEAVHVLNPTARVVWELCDAQHTADDMAQALRASFDIPPDRDVLADVAETLAAFSTKGLLRTE